MVRAVAWPHNVHKLISIGIDIREYPTKILICEKRHNFKTADPISITITAKESVSSKLFWMSFSSQEVMMFEVRFKVK